LKSDDTHFTIAVLPMKALVHHFQCIVYQMYCSEISIILHTATFRNEYCCCL